MLQNFGMNEGIDIECGRKSSLGCVLWLECMKITSKLLLSGLENFTNESMGDELVTVWKSKKLLKCFSFK